MVLLMLYLKACDQVSAYTRRVNVLLLTEERITQIEITTPTYFRNSTYSRLKTLIFRSLK